MTIKVVNKFYPEHNEREQFVSLNRSSASIFHHSMVGLDVGRSEMELTAYEAVDLHAVLGEIITMLTENGAFLTGGE